MSEAEQTGLSVALSEIRRQVFWQRGPNGNLTHYIDILQCRQPLYLRLRP